MPDNELDEVRQSYHPDGTISKLIVVVSRGYYTNHVEFERVSATEVKLHTIRHRRGEYDEERPTSFVSAKTIRDVTRIAKDAVEKNGWIVVEPEDSVVV